MAAKSTTGGFAVSAVLLLSLVLGVYSAPRYRRRAPIFNREGFGQFSRKVYPISIPVNEMFQSRLPLAGHSKFTVGAEMKRGFSPVFLKSNPHLYLQEPVTRDFSYDDFEDFSSNEETFGNESDSAAPIKRAMSSRTLETDPYGLVYLAPTKRAMSSRTLENDPYGIVYNHRSAPGIERRSWPDAEYLDEQYFKPGV